MVRMTGLEPACREALEPKSSVSANSTTSAVIHNIVNFTQKSTEL